jgi:hypothetical protein
VLARATDRNCVPTRARVLLLALRLDHFIHPSCPQGIPKVRDRADVKGALRPEPGSAPMGLSANVGRTETDFQWDLRIVNGLLLRWRDLAAGLGIGTNGTAKGQREAGL